MRRIFWSIFILVGVVARAQTLPDVVTLTTYDPAKPIIEGSKTVRLIPPFSVSGGSNFGARIKQTSNIFSPDPIQNKNYIKIEDSRLEFTDPLLLNTANNEQRSINYIYFDGLGRISQTVQVQGSANSNDIVLPVEYDAYGRQTKKYLPYSIASDGKFRDDALSSGITQFFDPNLGVFNNKVKTDASPYAEIRYESSPANALLEEGSPGSAWKLSTGKTTKYEHYSNVDGSATGQERIKKWVLQPMILYGKTEFILADAGYYDLGMLYVNVVKDEDNRVVREYKDKDGKIILKKSQYVSSGASINNDDHWTCTYFIYDDFKRLRLVLQPKLIARIAIYNGLSSDLLKKNMLDSLSLEYRYDERGRVIYKRGPGAQPAEMVYDRWDRLVLSQDGNQRSQSPKWTFLKYDVYNRVIMGGEIASNNTRDQMVAAVSSVVNRYENYSSSSGSGYTLTLTYPVASTLSNINFINFYDNYAFKSNLGLGTAYDPQPVSGFSVTCEPEVLGKVTGAKTRILGTSDWQISATYYDERYRKLQQVDDDHLGNKNVTTNEYYGITNWMTRNHIQHGSRMTSLTEIDYDHQGRIMKVWKTMDNNPATRVIMVSNQYNELDQLVEKNIHSVDDGSTYLQSNDYRFNTRGWITSINNSSTTNDGIVNDDSNDLFGMEFKYQDVLSINGVNTTNQFSGNISAIQWKINNLVDPSVEKVYGFKYDNINRLTDATYAEKNGATWTANVNLYDENVTYDKNGNIKTLKRNSRYNSSSVAQIDNLTYYYLGNQLDAVSDNATASNKPYGFSEIMAGITAGEYAYDNNGSMIIDLNKGLVGNSGTPQGIEYNYLGLVNVVRMGQKKITYLYNARGEKLRKVFYQNGTETSRIDYVGDIQYENNVLKFVSTSEGRVIKNGSVWEYEYFHKDHQGNARVVFGYKKQVDSYKATMETVKSSKEESQFKNVSNTRVTLYNHTPSSQDIVSPISSAETNGFLSGAVIGPAKMLQVTAGDRIQLEVFARYNLSTGSNNAIITTLASAVTGTFGLSNVGETASAFQALNTNLPTTSALVSKTTGTAKAYLFYILFDSNYAYRQFGYHAITTDAAVNHERLFLDVTMPSNGFLYTYVVNESNVSAATSVYFDDFSIIHTRATSALQVVQTNDYFPFGLQSNSWVQENSTSNNYLYNDGSELSIFTGFYETPFRQYDPALGRFTSMDRLVDNFPSWNPYQYAYNNPVFWNDPTGLRNGSPGDNPGFNDDVWDQIVQFWAATPEGGDMVWSEGPTGWVGSAVTGMEAFGNDIIFTTGGFYGTDGHPLYIDGVAAMIYIHIIPKLFVEETMMKVSFTYAMLNAKNKTDLFDASSASGYLGLVAATAEEMLKIESKIGAGNFYRSAATARAAAAEAAEIMGKTVGPALGGVSLVLTVADGFSDDNWTAGDWAKAGLGVLTIAAAFNPVTAGLATIYAVADVTVGITTGTSITDRIGSAMDNKFE